MTEKIFENNLINSLVRNFTRSPNQLNKTLESDVEIINIEDKIIIAATTDSIVEEIESGLYKDPYLIGWMIVNVNFSDLAAAGANQLGILISEIIPSSIKNEYLQEMQNGINDACKKLNSFVLGGDTNLGEKLILTGTALGYFENNNYLTRKGCLPNQILYSTNKLGRGNAFAITQLLSNKEKIKYLPIARLKESKIIKKYASASMDTSDGVISTLDQLMRINNCGFEFDEDWKLSIDDESKIITEKNGIPLWLLLAGQHGEFELLFTIDGDKEKQFLSEAELINWQPIKLGKVIPDKTIKISLYGKLQSINSAEIRNLSFNLNEGVHSYLNSLLEIDNGLR